MKQQSKKTSIQIMYETVMEHGGSQGPFSQAVVDAYEGKGVYADGPKENKVIIQFKKEVPWRLK